MKLILALLLLAVVIPLSAAPETKKSISPTQAPSLIELRDQFDSPQRLSFPTTNVTLLTIADRKGSEQLVGWIKPIKQRYSSSIAIHGIADVSTVPRPLRSMVRKKFQKVQTYPVMMDWTGEVVNAFTYTPDQANLLLLNQHGKILRRVSGAANQQALQDLCATIDSALVVPH